ncbi:MAG: hypothetical protein IPM07_27760 [Anaerolineales bacterium]|nr:hypothetical protein [Anaerolineales bacterium]
MTIKETLSPTMQSTFPSSWLIFSHRQLADFRRSHPDAGVLDLKAFFRGS